MIEKWKIKEIDPCTDSKDWQPGNIFYAKWLAHWDGLVEVKHRLPLMLVLPDKSHYALDAKRKKPHTITGEMPSITVTGDISLGYSGKVCRVEDGILYMGSQEVKS